MKTKEKKKEKEFDTVKFFRAVKERISKSESDSVTVRESEIERSRESQSQRVRE